MKLKFILLAFLLSFAVQTLWGQPFTNALFIPDTLAGPTYNLTVAPSTKQFLGGNPSGTLGINGDYLGPTLIMRKGDQVQMNVTNNIGDTSTMHWHGMHVAPNDDGGPHTMILPADTWSPAFTVLDEATTFWYHPHLHHKTAQQVYAGAAGMIIVRDDHSDSLNLPHTYGVDDFPLIIQDKTFDTDNEFIFAALADTMMVNGTLSPYLEVPAQWVRFRLLNASNQRVYNFGFAGNSTTLQIGTDGGLLPSPVPITRMLLAPGERAEIVVNFGAMVGANLPFSAFNSEMGSGVSGGPMGPGGGPGNHLDGSDFDLLQIRVQPPIPGGVTNIPMNLNTLNIWDEADADRVRVKLFDTLPGNSFLYLINSTPFNIEEVNDTVLLDDIEVWKLYNNTDVAHPFHIHDIQFFILDINGLPAPPSMRGRKDVVLTQPGDSVTFITKFETFTDSLTPYMYHCHNLFHEDAGMMGQFLVMEEGWVSRNKEVAASLGMFWYPNPTTDKISLSIASWDDRLIKEVKITSLQGQNIRMLEPFAPTRGLTVDLSPHPSGIYFFQILLSDGNMGTIKVVKE